MQWTSGLLLWIQLADPGLTFGTSNGHCGHAYNEPRLRVLRRNNLSFQVCNRRSQISVTIADPTSMRFSDSWRGSIWDCLEAPAHCNVLYIRQSGGYSNRRTRLNGTRDAPGTGVLPFGFCWDEVCYRMKQTIVPLMCSGSLRVVDYLSILLASRLAEVSLLGIARPKGIGAREEHSIPASILV